MSEHQPRTADHEIDPIFLERWSPRAFTGEAVPREDLFRMFEAVRWAPSSYNSQPWRLVYALRDTPDWERFLDLLIPFNRGWAEKAGALVLFVSKSTLLPPGKTEEIPSVSHSFDCGSGWAMFALQALKLGYHAHGMVGFDMDTAFAALHVPVGYRVEMMAAVGRKADPSTLPEQVREREFPNGRERIEAFAFEGGFTK